MNDPNSGREILWRDTRGCLPAVLTTGALGLYLAGLAVIVLWATGRLPALVGLTIQIDSATFPAPPNLFPVSAVCRNPMSQMRSYLVAKSATNGRSFIRPNDWQCAYVTMKEQGSLSTHQPEPGLGRPE